MDDELTPRAAESVPVVLARMDGKLDRIWDKFTDQDQRVGKLEDRMKVQEELTLILSKDAAAEAKEKVALALALKEADEARRNQSEQSWSPFQKSMAVILCIVGVATLCLYFYSIVHK